MVQVTIITLQGVAYDAKVNALQVPTKDGEIGVYSGHSDLIAALTDGVIKLHPKTVDGADSEYFACHGGLIEIENGAVRIIADDATASSDLQEKEIEAAYKEAVEARASARNTVELDKAQSLVDRQAVRLHVAKLRRRKP
jgi:F-type H+-transporting ATPase subunit epsilon